MPNLYLVDLGMTEAIDYGPDSWRYMEFRKLRYITSKRRLAIFPP